MHSRFRTACIAGTLIVLAVFAAASCSRSPSLTVTVTCPATLATLDVPAEPRRPVWGSGDVLADLAIFIAYRDARIEALEKQAALREDQHRSCIDLTSP